MKIRPQGHVTSASMGFLKEKNTQISKTDSLICCRCVHMSERIHSKLYSKANLLERKISGNFVQCYTNVFSY